MRSPSPTSEIGDICFRCNFITFALQARGGLDENEIVAIFADQQPAVELAEKLLDTLHGRGKQP